MTIIADESFASFDDLESVLKYSHGINIKMEKCGGPLEAIKTLK
jgi:L-alanine-DL-glutamate epimerase-like enolase superfamily enzyme